MTEYIKGARYRVTFEGRWEDPEGDAEGLSITDQWKFYPGYILEVATSVEKIADPAPEWLPGDKVLRSQSVAVYKGDDTWNILYDSGHTDEFHTETALRDVLTVLVKQGKQVVQ